MHQTPRLKLDVQDGGDNVSAYPPDVSEAYAILDNAVTYSEDTISNRPAAGLSGRVFRATDLKQWFDDDGTGWNLRPVGNSGSSIVATSQSTSSATYTTLGTPDQVTGLVLGASALIEVSYQATWQTSAGGDPARAAIFLNGNQQQVGGSTTPVTVAAATHSAVANTNMILSTCPTGLIALTSTSVSYPGDVTTGQAIGVQPLGTDSTRIASQEIAGGAIYITPVEAIGLGGPCRIFAAAGTYTVAIKFKCSSGSVTASNRRLYVRVVPF